MNKLEVEVCFSPFSYSLFENKESVVVVIDVLRATSAICTAFHHGVQKIIPVASVEKALEYKKLGYTVAAERQGEVVEGFEFGNSPFSYMGDAVKGKNIVLTTTNGTRAVDMAKEAGDVVIGSFLNLTKLSKWLISQNRPVVLLCAGWRNKFNLEDTLCAGALAKNVLNSDKFETFCDSTLAAIRMFEEAKDDLYAYLEDSSHRKRLTRLNLDEDIRYCLDLDKAPVIPILEGNFLKKLLEL